MDLKTLLARIENKEAKIGVIGLGYVGLPLVMAFCRAGFKVLGFDIDESKTSALNRGESYILTTVREQYRLTWLRHRPGYRD